MMRNRKRHDNLSTRRKIVGVMGSSEDEHRNLADIAGRVIAMEGCHLLTGGGEGVMKAVSRAFVQVKRRKGMTIGVLRGGLKRGVAPDVRIRRDSGEINSSAPNEFVEIPIFTHLPYSGARGKDNLSRNHINVLTSDVVVVLPGSLGTRSELELAIEYGRPVILFLGDQTVAGADANELVGKYHDRMIMAPRNEFELMLALRSSLLSSRHTK